LIDVLRYGDRETTYSVSFVQRLASKILIHVYPSGEVEVEAPEGSEECRIRGAVQKRARWVFANVDAANNARAYALPREYVGGETHFYLGRRYRLHVLTKRGVSSSVKLVGGRIEVIAPVADPAAVKRRLKEWYQIRAQDYFARRLYDIVAKLPWLEAPPPMKIVTMKQQWGSCSPAGSINLNPALIRAPRHCIDYVLLHELCHLQEHNHSKRFYALLSKYDANWVATKVELDRLADILLVE
jgi:predicted metal-dependent hydrolase